MASLPKMKSLFIAADMLGFNQGEVLLRIKMLHVKLGIELVQRLGGLVKLNSAGLSFAPSSVAVLAIPKTGAGQAGVAGNVATQFELPEAAVAPEFAFRRKHWNMIAPGLAAIVASLQECK